MKALAGLLLAASVNAHMNLAVPVPFSYEKVKEDKAPITAQQYPCKIQYGFDITQMNNIAVGAEQTLSFDGTAIHGGGSCQLSVTTDKVPTASSKFKVIMSMEGGCPGTTAPEQFKFKLPDSIPNGQVTLAWTWFSRLSGGPELYMNCAPVTVTGGASDTSKFDQLPDMFVANIASVDCKSPPNFNVLFPDPGQNVLTDESAAKNEPPTGSACGKAVSGGGASASGGATSAAAAQSSAAVVQSSAVQSSAAAAIPTSNPGGVFAPSASSAAAIEPTSTMTTLVTVTASLSDPAMATSAPAASEPAASASEPAASEPAASEPAASASAPAAVPTSSGGGGTGCTTNGAVLCNGPTQFGLCDNGKVVWQPVAAGTTCSNGQITRRAFHRQLRGRVALPRAEDALERV